MPRDAAHCPHCLLVLPDADGLPYPRQPMRCTHCRLVIGAGRCVTGETVAGATRAHGTAAGVVANAARREHGDTLEHAVVEEALRDVAAERGCALDRLRMLDYQQEAEMDPDLPPLAGVIATFGSWKKARAAATDDSPAVDAA